MAPEQVAKGGGAVQASDIWAFGLILYSCFHCKLMRLTLDQVRAGALPEPTAVNAVWTSDIDKLFRECTKSNPDERIATAELVSRIYNIFSVPNDQAVAWSTKDRVPPSVNICPPEREWW